MSQAQTTTDNETSSENQLNAHPFISPLKNPKAFIRLQKERHKSMSLSRSPAKADFGEEYVYHSFLCTMRF